MDAIALERYADGRSDDLPDWTAPLLAQRTLWKEYGVPWQDPTFTELVDALRLDSALRKRRG